jgi:hypothetical protein
VVLKRVGEQLALPRRDEDRDANLAAACAAPALWSRKKCVHSKTTGADGSSATRSIHAPVPGSTITQPSGPSSA